MPLTLSHAAAVLPLRRRLPLAALVVGAMVPDLPYYAPLPVSAGTTHGWQGAVLVDLPAGAALLVLFELVLRTPLTALAPEGLRARLPGPAPSAPSGPAPYAVLGSGGAPSLYDLVRSVLLGAMDGCVAVLACHAIVWHALGWPGRARGHDVPS
ncbi:DUF4184 family protein [Sphaerisporangium viridialbum]|uniref:DUF4184 family protein n=1 Tax=Sphaerisporangium viridialbum TaxID=46189 RepID=UPI003C784775